MSLPQRLARLLPVSLLACLALGAAAQDNDDYCGTVGECLGSVVDDLVVLGVLVLLGPALLWASRLPRVAAHSLVMLLVGGCLWFGADALTTALVGARPLDDTPLPLPVALLVGLAAGLVAAYACGPGRLLPRLAVLAAAPAVAGLAHVVSEQLALARL